MSMSNTGGIQILISFGKQLSSWKINDPLLAIKSDNIVVTDKLYVVDLFNQYFKKSGHFDVFASIV